MSRSGAWTHRRGRGRRWFRYRGPFAVADLPTRVGSVELRRNGERVDGLSREISLR